MMKPSMLRSIAQKISLDARLLSSSSVKIAAQIIQRTHAEGNQALNELEASAQISLIPKALWFLNRDQKFDVVSESSRSLLLNAQLSQEAKVDGLHAAIVALGRSKKPMKARELVRDFYGENNVLPLSTAGYLLRAYAYSDRLDLVELLLHEWLDRAMESTITKNKNTRAFDSAMALFSDIKDRQRKKQPVNKVGEQEPTNNNEFDMVLTPLAVFNFGSLSQSVPDLGTWCVLLKTYADRGAWKQCLLVYDYIATIDVRDGLEKDRDATANAFSTVVRVLCDSKQIDRAVALLRSPTASQLLKNSSSTDSDHSSTDTDKDKSISKKTIGEHVATMYCLSSLVSALPHQWSTLRLSHAADIDTNARLADKILVELSPQVVNIVTGAVRAARILDADLSLVLASGKLSAEQQFEEEATAIRKRKSLEKAARNLISAFVTELCKCGQVHNADQMVVSLRSGGKAEAVLSPAVYATIVHGYSLAGNTEKALEYFMRLLSWPQEPAASTSIPTKNSTDRAAAAPAVAEQFYKTDATASILVSVLPMTYHHMCEGYRRANRIEEMNDFIHIYRDFISTISKRK